MNNFRAIVIAKFNPKMNEVPPRMPLHDLDDWYRCTFPVRDFFSGVQPSVIWAESAPDEKCILTSCRHPLWSLSFFFTASSCRIVPTLLNEIHFYFNFVPLRHPQSPPRERFISANCRHWMIKRYCSRLTFWPRGVSLSLVSSYTRAPRRAFRRNFVPGKFA